MISAQKAEDRNPETKHQPVSRRGAHTLTGSRPFQALFAFFLALVLLNHAIGWQQGPFTWDAFAFSANLPWRLGPMMFLPLGLAAGLGWQWYRGPWTWGSLRLTGPMLLFSFIVLFQVWQQQLPTTALAIGLFWLIYLALINMTERQQRPFPTYIMWALLAVLFIQGSVGTLQFVRQQDVGLRWLGEPVLHPEKAGSSVVYKDGARWLRAHGINGHPNRLGMKLTMLLLLLWSRRPFQNGRRRIIYWMAMLAGLGGLITSLSRSAWLALAIGGLVYVYSWWREERPPFTWRFSLRNGLVGFLLVAALTTFLLLYGDTLTGRFFRLNTPLERRSLTERARDLDLAWQVLQTSRWRGVGLGNLSAEVTQLDPFAGIVHVNYLYVAVELGLLGLAPWLGFILWPLLRTDLSKRFAPQTAVWVALMTIGIFQPGPLPMTMQGAALWSIAAALWHFRLRANLPQTNHR